MLYDAVRLTVVLGTFASFASTEKPDSALTIRAVTQRPENSGRRFALSRADFCIDTIAGTAASYRVASVYDFGRIATASQWG